MPSGPPLEPLHPSSEPPDIRTFDHWELAPEVHQAIADMGIVTPTPIQRLTIQHVLERRDVIAQAETGTGKTLAFGAPVISLIDPSRVSVQALVLCPTRELAQQVCKVLEELGEARDITAALIVGGEPAGPQVDALKGGAQIVVGTPGRVLDLMGQGFLSFPWTEFVVLDEADEMLEIGFLDDVEKILSATDPEIRSTLLFSATFPPELLKLARKHSSNPAEIATASGVATVDTIEQDYFIVEDEDRPLALIRMIEQSGPDDVLLVFCERRTEVERLMRRLERLPFPIKALHGGYDQEARFRVMGAFRRREVKALVATDVASRGLDVEHVTHVVNFSVPRDVTGYTHRIGRTGRAGREGHATTLVPAKQARRWQSVLREASWSIREVDPPGPTLRRGGRGRDAQPRPAREREGGARERESGARGREAGRRNGALEPDRRQPRPEVRRAPEPRSERDERGAEDSRPAGHRDAGPSRGRRGSRARDDRGPGEALPAGGAPGEPAAKAAAPEPATAGGGGPRSEPRGDARPARPRRERRPRPQGPDRQRGAGEGKVEGGGGFGAGVVEPPRTPRPEPAPPARTPRPDRPARPAREPAREKEHPPTGPGGFGAGIL